MKLISQPTLADSICDIHSRKINKVFFSQIYTLLDWDTKSSSIN